MKSKNLFTLTLTAATLFAGCSDQNLFNSAPGHFEGLASTKKNGRVQQALVGTDISLVSKTELDLKIYLVKDVKKEKLLWEFNLKANDKNNLDLSGQKLKKDSTGCFINVANQAAARLCYDGHEITVDLANGPGGVFSLIIDRYDATREPVLETPRSYTLTELVDRSINRSFNTRAEFEQVIQAKLAANNALQMMAPHLSSANILGVVLGGWTSLYTAVGNLIPFVFPNRWFQVKEAELAATSEHDTWILMKADTANIAEGFGYAIERDVKIIASMKQNIVEVTLVRDKILDKERLHLMPVGSSDDITTIIVGLELGVVTLQQAVNEERENLAQAVGFFNAKAITDIQIGGDLSVEAPLALDTDSIMEVTKQRSYELHQMDTLINRAHYSKLEAYFTPFDLTGSQPFGVNLLSSFQVAPSQIRQLGIQREGLEAQLIGKTTALFEEINESLDAYQLSKNQVAVDTRRVATIQRNIELGITYVLASLSSALISKAQDDVNQITWEYSYYVGITKINRLLFAGPYARLAPTTGWATPGISTGVISK